MKLKNTILYIAALSLFSCEMKNEILDGNKNYEDVGYLNLGVYAQNKLSKAATDNGENPNSPVSADNFEVEINNSEGVFKEFDSYSELQAAGKIELPVGKYTVKAHTPGDIQPKMSSPYYYGETALEIVKDVEKTATVNCKMKNTKIQLVYGETFATVFKSWSITVSDGSSNILTYDQSNPNPSAVYWLIADNVSEITVRIEAYLQDGTKITEDRSITKPEDAESDYWAGSDALTITMEPGKPNPSGVTIDIKVEVSFTDSEVTEEIPVEPGDDNDNPGGGEEADAPTLSGEYLGRTVTYDKGGDGVFPEVSVEMNVPGKIESVMIKVSKCTDPTLESILSSMGFMNEPDGIDLVTTTDEILVELLELPKKGSTSYTFKLGGLGNMLTIGKHTFEVKVTDQNGKEASGSLSFDITDSTETDN
ncbi:DUF4493 domain-containing protein [uncultured Bacteroides sp.]|uniref:DUF4493 domain-containing protein n=1 Tax=uncultured Bacteroides sp. TaxID=162156 RepID=UPI00261E2C46|nr:DUF4493 domain-containing protein [uncultured Bacteroides sp.]